MDEPNFPCVVVVNDEEQYSIWPEGRELPEGWHLAPMRGSKSECLAWIDKTWTDLRPLSLRRELEALGTQVAEDAPGTGAGSTPERS